MTAGPMAVWPAVDPVLPLGWCIAVLGLLLGVMAWATWRRPPPVSGRRRAVLAALRFAAALCAAVLVLRPAILRQGREVRPSQVAILLDASRSQQIRDCPAGPKKGPGPLTSSRVLDPFSPEAIMRAQAVRDAFIAADRGLRDLSARRAIRLFAFGSRLRPIDTFAPVPDDARTFPAEALGALGEPGSALAAVILVSDGCASAEPGRSAEEAAARLAAEGIAVHAVGVGSTEPSGTVRDASVRDLRAPARVLARGRAAVRVVAGAVGLKGRPVHVVLTVNGAEADRRTLTPDSDLEARELVFEPTLAEAGLARLAVEARPVAGELTEANNRAETLVRVEEGGVRVLYLEGRLRPEAKYVARVLGGSPEMDLDRRILVGPGAADTAPKPADLDACDVVVLGDLPARALSAETVDRLARRVEEGMGLVAMGGVEAYGAGGWAATPLAVILPLAIRAGDGQIEKPVRPVPTAVGGGHFILDFAGRGAAGGVFGRLPPLAGANILGPPTAGAAVLAASEDGNALLAVRQVGRGRTVALAADTTWLWVLAPDDPDGPQHHAGFWRQVVLWAAGRDGRPKEDLWIMTDRPRYLLAAPERLPRVEVTAYARGAAMPQVILTRPDGSQEAVRPAALGAGHWRATLRPDAAGAWTILAKADAAGEARQAETMFQVQDQDLEWATVLADHDGLRRIAEAGRGTFRRIGDLPALLEELARSAPVFETVERRAPLASSRAFLAVFLALLASEWALRRTWGLA